MILWVFIIALCLIVSVPLIQPLRRMLPVGGQAGLVIAACLLLIPIGVGGGVYLRIGQPESLRLVEQWRSEQAEHNQFTTLAKKLAGRLREEPDDLPGWLVLARTRRELGQLATSSQAYREFLQRSGAEHPWRSDILVEYGEGIVLAGEGEVTDQAKHIFQSALELQPGHPVAIFFLALASAQAGDFPAARAGWSGLLANPPAGRGAAFQDMVRTYLTTLPSNADVATAPRLSAEQLAAAQNMSAAERQEMISAMVERLARRLSLQPRDVTGWLRLVGAYRKMGRVQEAERALQKAREVFAGNEGALRQLR